MSVYEGSDNLILPSKYFGSFPIFIKGGGISKQFEQTLV
jgi:hypothetical protein